MASASPSREASPRRSRSQPTRHHRHAPRSPSSWCSAGSTDADSRVVVRSGFRCHRPYDAAVRPRHSLGIVVACAALAAAPAAHAGLTLTPAFSGSVSSPMYVTSPPGDSHRLFIVTRLGVIRVAVDGVLQSTAFLTIPNVWQTG